MVALYLCGKGGGRKEITRLPVVIGGGAAEISFHGNAFQLRNLGSVGEVFIANDRGWAAVGHAPIKLCTNWWFMVGGRDGPAFYLRHTTAKTQAKRPSLAADLRQVGQQFSQWCRKLVPEKRAQPVKTSRRRKPASREVAWAWERKTVACTPNCFSNGTVGKCPCLKIRRDYQVAHR